MEKVSFDLIKFKGLRLKMFGEGRINKMYIFRFIKVVVLLFFEVVLFFGDDRIKG